MNVVNAVSFGLKDVIKDEAIELLEGETIGEFVESNLMGVCYALGEVAAITEGKIDVDFLLSIVGSYLVSLEKGELEEDTPTPKELFNTTMVEAIENYVEPTVEEDGDGEPTDNPTT
jgi:hypothetical protein